MNPLKQVQDKGQQPHRNWIQGAIKHPGLLHRELGVAQDQTIPAGKMEEAIRGKYGVATQKRANFARELGAFRKARGGK